MGKEMQENQKDRERGRNEKLVADKGKKAEEREARKRKR